MKKSNSGLVVLVMSVVLLGGAFYGGMKYDQKSMSSRMKNRQGGPMVNATADGNSFINGEVLSKDDESVTLKLASGGSKIVFISSTTQVMKSTSGSVSDVVVGQQITANGKANADGSVNATTVSIRPAGEPTPPVPDQTATDAKK